jgi:Lrp/AsnC family leucine-responsive transcriptional regulator
MPVHLDGYDISILKALMKDGRKSFRQISRETSISTPTVKARFERLVNIGFVKAVIPIIDFERIEENNRLSELQIENMNTYDKQHLQQQEKKIKSSLKKGVKILLNCDFCKGIIASAPQVLKFANYERFFCCNSCKSEYKKKYGGRIEAIKERYKQ